MEPELAPLTHCNGSDCNHTVSYGVRLLRRVRVSDVCVAAQAFRSRVLRCQTSPLPPPIPQPQPPSLQSSASKLQKSEHGPLTNPYLPPVPSTQIHHSTSTPALTYTHSLQSIASKLREPEHATPPILEDVKDKIKGQKALDGAQQKESSSEPNEQQERLTDKIMSEGLEKLSRRPEGKQTNLTSGTPTQVRTAPTLC